ncbi:MAG TPA: DUF2461 domain-containing protein [Thermoplasmata archaeon]|nr:DUF2461 domain-containing protein [Thermoplasmata archaeon]
MAAATNETGFFGPEAFRFLRELAKNNNRPWLLANKARYESAVQAPALRFIQAMTPRLSEFSVHIVAEARPFGGALSRVYRDTRFSKDKSPYKTHVGIHFAHEDAGSGEHLPGFFFHMGPGESMVAAGMWHPSPPALTKIRDAIVASPAGWAKVLKGGIEIEGESYARVPAGYPADRAFSVDLRRKDFFASHAFSDAEVASDGFARAFLAACRTLNPLNTFLARATGTPW